MTSDWTWSVLDWWGSVQSSCPPTPSTAFSPHYSLLFPILFFPPHSILVAYTVFLERKIFPSLSLISNCSLNRSAWNIPLQGLHWNVQTANIYLTRNFRDAVIIKKALFLACPPPHAPCFGHCLCIKTVKLCVYLEDLDCDMGYSATFLLCCCQIMNGMKYFHKSVWPWQFLL